MSMFLFFGGLVLVFIGAIKVLIEAFSESVLWGLGCLIVPIVTLFFVFTHWRECRAGFVMQLVGLGMFFLAGHLGTQ